MLVFVHGIPDEVVVRRDFRGIDWNAPGFDPEECEALAGLTLEECDAFLAK